jgi:hypothetical protein
MQFRNHVFLPLILSHVCIFLASQMSWRQEVISLLWAASATTTQMYSDSVRLLPRMRRDIGLVLGAEVEEFRTRGRKDIPFEIKAR